MAVGLILVFVYAAAMYALFTCVLFVVLQIAYELYASNKPWLRQLSFSVSPGPARSLRSEAHGRDHKTG